MGQARQQSQQAGLAGPVFSAHVQPLARIHGEVEPGEQRAFAAHTGQVVGSQH
jgi:hypothetical protein